MKKRRLFSMAAIFVIMFLIAGCAKKGKNEVTVTFYDSDGTSVLKTEKVEEGGLVSEFIPEKEGYTFVGWYATPSMTHKFNFSNPIKEDISVYGQFASDTFVKDTREFYIVGTGRGEVLNSSDWGKLLDDRHKLSLADKEGVNEYTITLDLFKGDEFQFAINASWENQRGAGYMTEPEKDGVAYFSSKSGFLDTDTRKSNLTVEEDGNYTLILTTHPWDDKYNTEHEYYSEETKENYNYSDFDTITFVRNGDVVSGAEEIGDIFVKGNILTGWDHIREDAYKMTNNGDGTYSYTTQLMKGDEIIFYTLAESGLGPVQIKADDIDREHTVEQLTLNPGANIMVNTNGTYTFTFDSTTRKTAVTYDSAFTSTYTPATDWFIVGSGASKLMVQSGWGNNITEDHRLTPVSGKENTYAITLDLEAGDQFQIVMNKNWAMKHSYSFIENPDKNFSDIDNVRVDVAGNYTLTLVLDKEDFTKDVITWKRNGDVIEKANGLYDVFLKQSSNDWVLSDKYTTTEGVVTFMADFKAEEAFCFIYFNAGVKVEDIGHSNPGSLITHKEKGGNGNANGDFSNKDKDFLATSAGTYEVTIDFTSGAPIVSFEKQEVVTTFDVYIKGTMTEWKNDNKVSTTNGIVEMEYKFAKGDEFGFAHYDEYTTESMGNWIGAKNIGTKGDANQVFSGDNNYTCTEEGTYRVVIDITSGTAVVDFYKK